MLIEKDCDCCGNPFQVTSSEVKRGNGKFCSRKCFYLHIKACDTIKSCLCCGKETNNPKFCSGSCSASYNNRLKSKRKLEGICVLCSKEISKTRSYCKECWEYKSSEKFFIEEWRSGKYDNWHSESVPKRIRDYLFSKYDSKCQKCNWSRINPITNKVPLTVNHIDGNFRNNKENNLELLCPNCHSLTENYGSLNKGKGRPARRAVALPV